jgi:hypothetical protein
LAIRKSYSILAQLAPTANILTDLYEAGAGIQTVISTIFICNQNSTTVYFDLSFAPDSAVDDPSQYVYKNQKLGPYLTFAFTTGVTLVGNDPSGDLIRAKSSNSLVSFSVFGVELTIA